LKAGCNLKDGLRGYALVKDDLIVGDIWCACPIKADEKVCHPDMDWLGIDGQAGEVYIFDMYIDPRERGNSLAAPFQKAALYALKADGYTKAYGYYWTDYLPALWMHRLLKWKERGRVQVWRFFSARGSSPA
jgi:GNAT superfamily N-acetyltransferase